MVVAPVRYTASSFALMKTGGSTAVIVLMAMMREDGNMPKMRSAISSASMLDSGCNVTAGRHSFLFMNVAWMKGLTLSHLLSVTWLLILQTN